MGSLRVEEHAARDYAKTSSCQITTSKLFNLPLWNPDHSGAPEVDPVDQSYVMFLEIIKIS